MTIAIFKVKVILYLSTNGIYITPIKDNLMTQPGQQQPGQYPPPQQRYGTPNYQPQQNQYPQIGYFGGEPEPKKGMPWWGWVLIVVGAVVIIGVVGTAIKNSSTTTNPTSQAGIITTAPAVNVAPTVVQSNATQARATTAPVTTAKSNELGVRATGAGQELIGQGGVQDGLKVTITGVDRFSQITGTGGKIIKSQGAFLVLSYEMDNQSSKPQYLAYLSLIDGTGRTFSSSTNVDAIAAIALSGNYNSDLGVQPSFKGKGYSVFEVSADASNLKLKVGF